MHSLVKELHQSNLKQFRNPPVFRTTIVQTLESNIIMSDTDNTAADINTNEPTVLQKFAFRFKKDKLGNKRAPVELNLPVPTIAGIVAILRAGGKELELLNDAIYGVIKSVAGEIVAEKQDVSQDNFPTAQVLWSAIANMPKAERATIPQEQWDGFAADYLAVMPGLTGKTADQVGLAVSIFMKKFSMVKTNKPILGKLKEQLALYMDTPNAENFQDVLDLLVRRVDAYLSAEEAVILAENL